MADYGISTLGVTFGYGVETTAGEKPASFTQLTRINDIGEISIDPEEIDASALEDYETHYVPGRATVSESVAVTVNRTDATVTEWESLISAYEALTGGKKMWFEVITPGITKAEFFVAAPPKILPMPAKSQNGLDTMVINLTLQDWKGLDTKVAFS